LSQKLQQMKKLSKLGALAFLAAVLFFTTDVKAQTTPADAFTLGLGIETGNPLGQARLGSHFTLGGTARLQYGITNDLAATLTAGGYHFFPIKIPGQNVRYGSFGEIPVKAGLKEFFLPNIYVAGEAGVAWEKLEKGWGPHRLDLSPGVGYANKHWDFSFRYENFSNSVDHFGLLGLRVGYGFGL
jgi:hypothetical protein